MSKLKSIAAIKSTFTTKPIMLNALPLPQVVERASPAPHRMIDNADIADVKIKSAVKLSIMIRAELITKFKSVTKNPIIAEVLERLIF